MYFWSHGQSFSGTVFKTKVVMHLPNSRLGQFLTTWNLALTPKPGRGWSKWGHSGSVVSTL
jgi:hypothetical protein